MRFSNPKSLWLALGVGVLTSVSLLPQARGEMVYERESQPVQMMQVPQQVYPAQVMPQQVQTVTAPQQVMPQPVVVQSPQYVAPPVPAYNTALSAPAETGNDTAGTSKSELVRRERMRTELRNEDVLQERLEELRLRDERRRTDELVSGQPISANPVAAAGMPQFAPTTERVGQMAQTPQMISAPVQVASIGQTPDQYNSMGMATSSASFSEPADRDVTIVYMQPRFGLTNFNNVTYYDVRSKYSAGLGLGISVSDNLSFEVGYTFSEFGVAMNSTNPFAVAAQVQANSRGYTGKFESVAMKQNIADAGLKIHFLGPSAKLRPFIGGGGGYSRSFINFSQNVITFMEQSGQPSPDYDMTQFLGFLSAGFDVRVNKAISIGAGFKYYSVLSSRQNQNINNMAFGYPNAGYYPGYYGYSMNDGDKQAVGGSLAQNSFYSITGGASFSF